LILDAHLWASAEPPPRHRNRGYITSPPDFYFLFFYFCRVNVATLLMLTIAVPFIGGRCRVVGQCSVWCVLAAVSARAFSARTVWHRVCTDMTAR
jgi:hypothetical protein